MSRVTTLTEQVMRELGIKEDWKIEQIAGGQNVCVLYKILFADGHHINTYIHSDVMAQVAPKDYSGPTLHVRGNRVNTVPLSEITVREGADEPLMYVGPQYVIVYTVYIPADPKAQSRRELSWLYVSPAVNMATLKEDYTKIFHS